jgi:hypothetical protein
MGVLRSLFGRHRGADQAGDGALEAARREHGRALIGQVEPIPGKLTVRLYEHDVNVGGRNVRCLTLLSAGLTTVGQDEVRLTLRSDQFGDAEVRDAIRFFPTLHSLAAADRTVSAYGMTGFHEDHFGFRAVAYALARPLDGVVMPAGTLAAVGLKAGEVEALQTGGALRALVRLGRLATFYPWPEVCECKRAATCPPSEGRPSLLAGVQRIGAGGSWVTLREGRVTLSVRRSTGPALAKDVAQLEPDKPFALLPGLDPTVRTCLVWCPGDPGPEAITAQPTMIPGDRTAAELDGAMTAGGCHCLFVPGQSDTGTTVVEDGFAVFLSDLDARALRRALDSGEPLEVRATGAKWPFLLTWREDAYYNPVDGRTYFSDWHLWRPQGPVLPPGRFQTTLRLLTSEEELASRTTPEQGVKFVKEAEARIAAVLDDFPSACELVVQFDCSADSHEVRVAHRGEIPVVVLSQLQAELGWLPTLAPVGGPVSLQLEIRVAAKGGGGGGAGSDCG